MDVGGFVRGVFCPTLCFDSYLASSDKACHKIRRFLAMDSASNDIQNRTKRNFFIYSQIAQYIIWDNTH